MKRLLVLLLLLRIPTTAAADTEADAAAMVDAWLAAQNGGDFAAYAALYDGKFVGIRRTSEGGEKKMKAKAWKADRKKMFKRKQEVAADERKITAVEGGAIARFVQRWKSGSYADHGTKVLRLQYDPEGALKIVREELLSSTPGWDDVKGTVLDATALVSPITVRLQGEGIDDSGGCASMTYVLYLKDSKKNVIQREIGTGDIMPDEESTATTLKIAPAGSKGLLFDVGEWCAGGADYYQIKHSGDALVVNYRGVGECPHDEPDCDPETKDTVLTIKLPEGAKLKTRK